MRRGFVLLLVLAGSCRAAAPGDFPPSACDVTNFEGSRITICSAKGGPVEIRTFGRGGAPLRSFIALQDALGGRSTQVAFAMNAGMFDSEGQPIGLLVEHGKPIHGINLRKGGGNFHLLPNGVFLVRKDGGSKVVASPAYVQDGTVGFATQSGPMLLIDGKLHSKLDVDGESRNIRNGVGIAPDGTPVFAISQDPISFGKFARFFREKVKARNALYFDGAVSSLWDPASHRMDSHSGLGPMVVVFKAAASGLGREALARP